MSEAPDTIKNGQSADALYPFMSIYGSYLKLLNLVV